MHLKKCCSKFDEMPKSTSNFFQCLANHRGVVGWLRVSKCAPEPKLQGNLMKCLNPLNRIFFTVWSDEGEGVKMCT